MKLFYTFFCLLYLTFQPAHAEFTGKILSFKEALQNEHLQFRIRGLDDPEVRVSRHFGKSLKISIKNVARNHYRISVPVGAILSPKDTNVQNMVVTKPLLIEVNGNTINSSYLYAMCIDMVGDSPQENDYFRFKGMADNDLLKACQFIEKMNYQNESGQDLLWAITDDLDPYDINGNEAIVKSSQQFLSKLIGFKIDPILQSARFETKGCGFGTQEFELLFQLYLEERSRLSLVLYNSKGELERTFFDRQDQAAGRWDIRYTVTGYNLSNRKFKAVLLVNGKEHSYYDFEFGENFSASTLNPECVNPKTYSSR